MLSAFGTEFVQFSRVRFPHIIYYLMHIYLIVFRPEGYNTSNWIGMNCCSFISFYCAISSTTCTLKKKSSNDITFWFFQWLVFIDDSLWMCKTRLCITMNQKLFLMTKNKWTSGKTYVLWASFSIQINLSTILHKISWILYVFRVRSLVKKLLLLLSTLAF